MNTQTEIDEALRQMEIREHSRTVARERIEDFRAARESIGVQCHAFYPPDRLWAVWLAPVIRPSYKLASVLYPKSAERECVDRWQQEKRRCR